MEDVHTHFSERKL